jgi:hypothetical protein
LGIAFGSLRECQAIIEMERIENPELTKLGDKLGAILYSLSRKNAGELNRNTNRTATDTDSDTVTG